MIESWIPLKHDFTDFFKLPIKMMNRGADENDEALFTEKLRNLSLLYDVPYFYLVPSENMLKLNEIRFFWLDSSWVKNLLDGACSIGRNASIDYASDTVFINDIYNKAISNNVNVRRQLQGKTFINGLDPTLPCTGFLLRSPLVGGWRGLEFIAYSDLQGQNRLTPLRLETLSSEILLGLYSGIIGRLDIKEPPEGFHYGFNCNDDGNLTKELRSIENGELLKDKVIHIRERGNRVINFSAAANDINHSLFPDTEEKPNSAHIALEMIQNSYMLRIRQK